MTYDITFTMTLKGVIRLVGDDINDAMDAADIEMEDIGADCEKAALGYTAVKDAYMYDFDYNGYKEVE